MDFPTELIASYNKQRKCLDKRSICHAPSQSMYFGRSGEVSACCYSRANALGRYPENTISEIWFGKAIGAFRRQLRKNTLPQGCELCATQLQAANYKGLLASNFDSFADRPLKKAARQLSGLLGSGSSRLYPSLMEFELSNTCNLECAMCNGFFSSTIRKNREKLAPFPELYGKDFVEQLKPFIPHLQEARFLGGEPFLIDVYYDIWELFIELNPDCRISITTNGTVLNQRVKRILEKLNCQLIVSLDSMDKPTYESIRVNAQFEKVWDNFGYFMEVNRQKGRPCSIAVCPTVLNWQELPEMIAYANRENIRVYFNTVIHPEHMALGFLPLAELELVYAHLMQASMTGSRDTLIERNNGNVLADLCKQIEFWIGAKAISTPGHKDDPDFAIKDQCRVYLEENGGHAGEALKNILEIISGSYDARQIKDQLSWLEGGDTEAQMRKYFSAIWELGTFLQKNGLIGGAIYNDDSLHAFLRSFSTLFEASYRQHIAGRLSGTDPLAMVKRLADKTPQRVLEEARASMIAA